MTGFTEAFKRPAGEYRPRLRYWWPGGYVAHDLEQLDREMQTIAAAGFGGVEIADVYDALSEADCRQLEPERYGFTSENWRRSIKQALKSAKKYGLKVDLTIGPHWPATTNEATPNQTGTAKELVYGTALFQDTIPAGTVIEALCPPHYQTSACLSDGRPITNQLIGLYKAEHTAHSEVEMPPAVPWEEAYTVISDEIVFDSLKEISDVVTEGCLTEAVRGGGSQNILIAVYQRGTGQRVNMFSMGSSQRPDVMAPYAYVVDHFSREGARLICSLWEKNFFDAEFLSLLQEAGDCFFEDSLELQSVGHWTAAMLTEFKERQGYDLRPYLPFVLGINQDNGLSMVSSCFQAETAHHQQITQLRHDYFEVLNALYQENHLQVLKQWAHKLQLKYRAQPYGWAIDSAAAASQLDIVEGESLGFGEEGNDAFRMLAAGRDFGGVEILSDEAGAYLFQGYATTLPQLLGTLHKNYLAGVNQTYWHGFPYKYAPGAKWPGFAAFNPMLGGRGFAEPWGPRQPVWQFLPLYTTYLARVQQVLRYGKNVCDILLYQTGHNASENKQTDQGATLTKLGYTYQVMTEGLFACPAQVVDGKLVVKGGSYRLLLLPAEVELSEAAAARLQSWQQAGLTVLHLPSELEQLSEYLGTSLFAHRNGALLTYRRCGQQHDFLVCYNQGLEDVSLQKLLSTCKLREWFPWTGTNGPVQRWQLAAGELRIFEKVTVADLVPPVAEKLVSLLQQPWQLQLSSWEASSAADLTIEQIRLVKELPELVPWSEINGWEHVAGVGTYQTTFELAPEKPRALLIPLVEGSLSVTLNGQELLGNPLTGRYELQAATLQTKNVLTITVASTLNNYLNDCCLTEHYGTYKQQKYGLEEVQLVYPE